MGKPQLLRNECLDYIMKKLIYILPSPAYENPSLGMPDYQIPPTNTTGISLFRNSSSTSQKKLTQAIKGTLHTNL